MGFLSDRTGQAVEEALFKAINTFSAQVQENAMNDIEAMMLPDDLEEAKVYFNQFKNNISLMKAAVNNEVDEMLTSGEEALAAEEKSTRSWTPWSRR